jgi:hypothetical protein
MNKRMQSTFIVLLGLCVVPAAAVDHNNIDANRPLSFDDAYSIGFGEKSLEFGAALVKPKNGKSGIEGEVEYLYGFAPNSHLNLGIDPSYMNDGNGRRLDAGDVSIGVFHNFNRELEGKPAFAIRADAALPTGRGSSGVDVRLRGIVTRTVNQYGRLHLNLDLGLNQKAAGSERKFVPGVVLGYSRPLGYPTRFNRTGLAELRVQANPDKGQSTLIGIGVGLRQQIGVNSVFDIGVQSDLAGGANRDNLQLVAGYSTQF